MRRGTLPSNLSKDLKIEARHGGGEQAQPRIASRTTLRDDARAQGLDSHFRVFRSQARIVDGVCGVS